VPPLTVELPDSLADRLAELASERGLTTEAVAREVLVVGLSTAAPGFIGVGRSGRADLSARAKELRRGGLDQQTILDRADELAARFENHDPDVATAKDAAALRAVRLALQARVEAEHHLAEEVSNARAEGHSWAAIAAMIGVSTEAAQTQYS
jgi:hypothetical protein